MLSIDHSIPKKISLIENEFISRDSISLEKLRAQANLYSAYAAYVNQFLNFAFVIEQARKFGIVRISFYDPDCIGMDPSWYDDLGWKDGSFAKIQKIPDRRGQYEIFLNPFLDLEEAALRISKQTKLRIKPEEVYYFSFFHECGHTRAVAGDLCPGKLLSLYLRSASESTIMEFKTKAEKIADAWAVKELKKWRRRKNRFTRCLPPAKGLLHA